MYDFILMFDFERFIVPFEKNLSIFCQILIIDFDSLNILKPFDIMNLIYIPNMASI